MSYLFKITGKVLEGNKRGKRFGFPTINMQLTQVIPEGVYVSLTEIDGKQYQSMTFIGAPKTFNETEAFVETYIFDFDKDIYGHMVTIYLLKWTRGNLRFASEKDLVEQMEKDSLETVEYFKKGKG